MVASTDIKFYVHTNTNAPQLTNDYGCMIAVLDACLINGMSVQTVASLTASGAIATATFNSAHQYKQYQVIEISGADQAEYNVQARILTVPNANSITFELLAAPVVTTATGTMTCKLPPLGWEKPFGNTGGKAAYRSSNLLLPSRPFLRVVDELDPAYNASYAKYAKVGIVEDMTDINTMLGVQAPFDAANPDKNWVASGSGASVINGWAKWYYAREVQSGINTNKFDTSAPSQGGRDWLLIGSGDCFYIVNSVTPTAAAPSLYGFGAFKSLFEVDNASNFLACSGYYASANTSSDPMGYTGLQGTTTSNSATTNLFLQRKYNGSPEPSTARTAGLGQMNTSFYSGSSDYLSVYDGNFVFSPVFIADQVATTGNQLMMRGKVPMLHWLYNNKPYADFTMFTKNGEIYIAKNIVTSGSTTGQIIFHTGSL